MFALQSIICKYHLFSDLYLLFLRCSELSWLRLSCFRNALLATAPCAVMIAAILSDLNRVIDIDLYEESLIKLKRISDKLRLSDAFWKNEIDEEFLILMRWEERSCEKRDEMRWNNQKNVNNQHVTRCSHQWDDFLNAFEYVTSQSSAFYNFDFIHLSINQSCFTFLQNSHLFQFNHLTFWSIISRIALTFRSIINRIVNFRLSICVSLVKLMRR